VAIFPVGLAVLVLLDGQAIPSYGGAYEAGGRVFGPPVPFVSSVALRGWREGDYAVFSRDGRLARIFLPGGPQALRRDDVALAAPLRDLGERVRYDPASRTLYVTTPAANRLPLERPTAPPEPNVAPRNVFTPEPVATPRPVWSGSPLPRRTPLPFPPR